MNKPTVKDVTETKQTIISFIKNKIFDMIGILILTAMAGLILNIFEGRKLTLDVFIDVLVRLAPFYFCAMLLSMNYYKKGVYGAKNTKDFTEVVTEYSDEVDQLTDDQIRHIGEFCIVYNEQSKKDIQIEILKSEGIEYDDFVNKYVKLTYFQLRKQYGKLIAKAVQKAKRVKIEGVTVNSLLGNRKSKDPTNFGPTENEMLAGRGGWYAMGYLFTIGFLTFIVAKNIKQWNWVALLYELAKVIYIFVRSYMRYFEGYEDITIKLSNSLHRKTDTIKAYCSWFKEKYPNSESKSEQKDTQNTSTEVENK